MAWKKWRFLGAGRYGSVHLAGPENNDSNLMDSDSVIAVKSGDSTPSIASLRVEANLLEEVRGCPYIIQGLGSDVSLEQGRMVYNLLLEYACFGNLENIIKNYEGSGGNYNMPESLVACYTYMLVKGLAILHEKEIVHCDFKPANVLVFPLPGLSSRGIHLLKISDLGLSKKEGEYCDDLRRGGTPLYASPEAVRWGLREKAGDIWALGCTVMEMITGRTMWSCNCSKSDLLHEIAFGSPRIPENMSEIGRDFLKRCLNKHHKKRWTAEMLLDHPFISRFGSYLRNQEVGLPRKPWICRRDMFSTPLEPQSDKEVYKTNKNQGGCGKPFFLPHELYQMTRNKAAELWSKTDCCFESSRFQARN